MVVCGCNSKPRAQPVNAAVKSRHHLVGRTVLTAVTFTVQPQVTTNFKTWSVGYIFPLLAVAGPAGVPVELRRKNQLNAFLAS